MARDHASDADEERAVTVRVLGAMDEIPAAQWDACANPPGLSAARETFNPFVSHAFLKALEDSGTVSARTGWLPQHLAVEAEDGTVAAAMPCYLKSHSFGEYVFDHGWADAYERAGGQYYPKLQVSVPFTPVTGRRLLTRPGRGADQARTTLIAGAVELCRRHDASSIHWTFLEEEDWAALGAAGMLRRTDQQFHWTNEGYASFDDFLAALASRKRKAIRKERREARENGIEVVRLGGHEISEADWDVFHGFYMDTGSRKWGRPYLNRRFFSLINEAMPDRILLVMARRAGRWIAGALNFVGGTTLYGRYWGCCEDHPFLHFELCYYQAIEHAIETGMKRVEAGAQGPHKLARGYLPVATRSAHYVADPGLRRAIADYLARERLYVEEETRLMAEHAPFRRGE